MSEPSAPRLKRENAGVFYTPKKQGSLMEMQKTLLGGHPAVRAIESQTPWKSTTIEQMGGSLQPTYNWVVVSNIFLFSPLFGEDEPNFDEHIFQMG